MNPTKIPMGSILQIAERKGLPAADSGSNFVFSPLSLRAALSLTASGTRGESLEELLSFLASPNIDHLHSSSARLLQTIHGVGDAELHLSFVNGVWLDRSMEINPSFVEIASFIHGAAAESVDFIHKAPLVQKEINEWIEEKTKGIFKDLIPNGGLNSFTRFILANALYFKGMWEEKFDRSITKDDKFFLLDGSTMKAPFMRSRKKQFISSYDDFKVLKLPYKEQGNSSFSMLIFLPNDRDGLHDLIRRLVSDPNFIEVHIPHERVGVDQFMVPRFKISFDFDAVAILSDLGLKSIFSKDANFRGLCSQLSSDVDYLSVSSIYHKAAIEIDEEGTTAAAATVVFSFGRSYSHIPPVNFIADHPFVYAVREDTTGAILFLGHVVNPLTSG